MNYRMIFYVLGWILFFVALFLFVPVITALIYSESEFWIYCCVSLICLLAGFIITRKRPENKTLYAREGHVIAALSWITLSISGALPLFLTGEIPSFIDALFESVSGFTTTGASVVADVEALSHATLIWRSFTHWIGGMGVLVFIMVFLPLSGATNMHIMKAESPGPSVSKLVPRVKKTASLLYSIYFVLTLVEFVLLLCGGMSVFQALNTAFATAGTGGFGVLNTSIGSFSPYIQIIVTIFMLLFSINFNSYYFLIKGKLREAFTTEVRVFLLIVFLTILLITINITGIYTTEDALRYSAFSVASLISTTGYSTVDFNQWPEISRALLVLVMFVGACAGSTGGGIKVSRIVILFKGLAKEIKVMIHPRQVSKIQIDSHSIDHETVRSVNVYMVCYVLIFVLSLLVISFDDHDMVTNFTAVTATINNIGPGLELVGPTANFAFFSDPAKLVLIFDMLAGRLELFPMLLLFTPATWKK